MLIEERRRAILEALRLEGRVLVAELGRRFRTSQVTIRKDLEILHATGKIHRTHGGALPAHEGALEDPSLREKEKLHRKEKIQIATAAANMVEEGQVVILDSGTTTTAIARALRHHQNLTIITNAVNIAAELAGSSLEVILTGGTLRKNSFSLVGPIAEETLRRLERGYTFPRRRRVRCPERPEHAQSSRSKSKSRHDGCCANRGGRMRFQQVRPSQSFHDCASVGGAQGDYRSTCSQERYRSAAQGGYRGHPSSGGSAACICFHP